MSISASDLKSISNSSKGRKRSGVLRVFGWGALLLVVALVFYLVSGRKEQPKTLAMGAVTITTATAKKGNMGEYLDAIGTVTPVYTASIFPQVTGVVVRVSYHEGQIVKKGDPLVDIDPRPYQAAYEQALGQFNSDHPQLEVAKRNLQRDLHTGAPEFVSEQQIDTDRGQVGLYEGAVVKDQGSLDAAKVNLEFAHITAPFDGRVGLRLVDPGNLLTANASAISSSSGSSNPLVVLTQEQPITVVFTIAENNLDSVLVQLRKGAKLTVEAYDSSGQTKLASGELLAVDNQIDTTTGTVKIRAIFDNKDFALFPNQFVNVRLLVQTLQDVTSIPSAAIQQNGKTSFVYVIQDNVAHLRNVKPGVTDNGLTQVEGINPGDVVADSSFDKLEDNTKITLAGGKPPVAQNKGNQGKQSSRGS